MSSLIIKVTLHTSGKRGQACYNIKEEKRRVIKNAKPDRRAPSQILLRCQIGNKTATHMYFLNSNKLKHYDTANIRKSTKIIYLDTPHLSGHSFLPSASQRDKTSQPYQAGGGYNHVLPSPWLPHAPRGYPGTVRGRKGGPGTNNAAWPLLDMPGHGET